MVAESDIRIILYTGTLLLQLFVINQSIDMSPATYIIWYSIQYVVYTILETVSQ